MYNCHLNLIDDKVAMNLELQNVKKYQKHMSYIADKLSYLQDFFPILIVFMNEAYINYDQKM